MNFAEVQVLMLLGSRRRRPPRRHGPSRRPEHCAFAADGRARQLPYPYQLQCDASLPTTCGSRSSLFSARRPCSSLLFRGGESGARPFQFGIPLARHPVVPALIGTVSSVGSSSSSTRRHGYVHVFTLSVALTWSGQPRAEAGRLRRLEGRPSCVKHLRLQPFRACRHHRLGEDVAGRAPNLASFLGLRDVIGIWRFR